MILRTGHINRRTVVTAFIVGFAVLAVGGHAGILPYTIESLVATTIEDFFQAGSQPNGDVIYETFVSSVNCRNCHGTDNEEELHIYDPWQGSMMAQAARDPLFKACLTVANQDAAVAGDLCIRCHAAGGWISGRSDPPDGSALTLSDRDGVSCSVCHRIVDPVFKPDVSPAIDESILADITHLPDSPGGGNYVLDSLDRRRGPYGDPATPGHFWLEAPFTRSASLCATCHDVSNPVYMRQPDNTYTLTSLNEHHPTGDKYDMFPIERTYSEWLNSEYASVGVDTGGRFGGNKTIVSTCQDCHMPTVEGRGCKLPETPVRSDLASHDFSGGNAWVQDMVLNLYPDEFLVAENLHAGKERSISMLQRAATMELSQAGNHLNIRLVNETGHKLPSGYPEGRRIWLNMKVFDDDGFLIEERGYYDEDTADLTTSDTKVYETHLGIDEFVSNVTGIPQGEGFHFALNNVIFKDNRIPPRGFTNAAFKGVQAAPVAAHYDDWQYWDDTRFRLPAGAASVRVNVYYQTASKEHITFLRDENHTDAAGDILYKQWELTGKSPPVLMLTDTIDINEFADGDVNNDGIVNLDDYDAFYECAGPQGEPLVHPICNTFDFDNDGDVDTVDFSQLQSGFDG